jgi:hypothetical protein
LEFVQEPGGELSTIREESKSGGATQKRDLIECMQVKVVCRNMN